MVFLCRECLQVMNIVNVMLHMSDGKHNNNNTSNKKARSKNSTRNAIIDANILDRGHRYALLFYCRKYIDILP